MSTDRARLLELDDEARRLAHTWFGSPLVVEAGAGTGKTALLTARVVAWCAGPGWQQHAADHLRPALIARRVTERIAAITFTEAAAAQMAERVATAFADLAADESPIGLHGDLLEVTGDELRERCLALVDEVHRLPVQTIHSFCHRLLRAYPLEAGLHPSFEVDAQGARVEQLVEEVVEAALRSATRGDDWQQLAAAGIGPRQVAEALEQLTRSGATPDRLRRDPFAPAAVAELAQRLRRALSELWEVESGRLEGGPDKTVAARGQLVELTDRLSKMATPRSVEELQGAVAELGEAARGRLGEWRRGRFTKTDCRALGGETAPLRTAAAAVAAEIADLTTARPVELAAARGLLAPLLAEVRERMRIGGIVTFDDLLQAAAALLEGSPAVAGEARRAIDQLLVDEFQDTDDTQCRIVASLALEGPDADRPGLFIVGDPKQSIYGWRRADLAAYDAFKERVEGAGGEIRPLVRNYRSHRPILDEVERVVAPVMVRRHGIQPAFTPLEATDERRTEPGFTGREWTPVEHWLAWTVDQETGVSDPNPRVDDATAVEGLAVARDIRRLHEEREVRWQDVALLVRKTTKLGPLLDALRDERVPFRVDREREYYRQREVVEAAALVRCVLEPADQLALLTVLRSDAVGVPDAALAPLWEAGLPAIVADLQGPDEAGLAAVSCCIDRADGLVPRRAPGLDALPGWQVALAAALETVAVLRTSVRRDPPDLFVERIRTLWLTEVTASARYLGRFRRARLERFFDQLSGVLVDGAGSSAQVARFLRRAVEEAREPELPSQPDVSENAVHVMTIHGAKGLDFGHVYLLQTHGRDGRPIGVPAVEWLGRTDSPCYRLFGWPTSGWAAAEIERTEREREERVRLLYVAMTRAKQRLVVSGGRPADNTTVAAADATSFADLIAHRSDPTALAGQAASGSQRRLESDGLVQWVLPALAPDRDRRSISDELETDGVDAERVAADAARLAELRVEAEQRMARPLVATVTGLAHRAFAPESGADDELSVPVDRDLARVVGTETHRMFECLDLDGDLVAQVRRNRPGLERRVTAAVGERRSAEAAARLAELLDRIERGVCLTRLAELGEAVLARELPLLLPPEDEPVEAVVGTADLVYRDGDQLVVADYKTDAVSEGPELDARVAAYRPQLELYSTALEQAVEQAARPRMELWFLHTDRIVRL